MAQNLEALTNPYPWECMDGFPANPLTVTKDGTIVDLACIVILVTTLYCLMDSTHTSNTPIDLKDPSIDSYLH